MPKTYVDVLLRVVVEHEENEDPQHIVYEANWDVGFEESDIKEVVVVGIEDKFGALIREDGGTGRNATILHDPPI